MNDEAARYLGVMASSTFRDLKDHRAALREATTRAGFYPVGMENDTAEGEDVITSSLGMVQEASVVFLVIGQKYGQIPKDPRNPDGLSITELEFNEAIRLERPLRLYNMAPGHLVTADLIELDPDNRRKLEAFRARAKEMVPGGVHRVWDSFASLEEFRTKITQALGALHRQLYPAKRASPSGPVPSSTTLPNHPALRADPPYRGRQRFIGRLAQLDTLDDWSTPANPDPLFLLHAIGGMGKSALAWHWLEQQAAKPWAGRFWFSFYERGATMSAFVTHALAYVTARRPADLPPAPMQEQAAELLAHLRAHPFLFVLDGAERLLASYHRYDAPQMRDEEADSMEASATSGTDPCATIRTADADLLRELASAAPSKLLLTSRLVPTALLNPARQPLPGARIEPLPGLRPGEAEQLLRSFSIDGTGEAMQRFLQESCGCHPLVIGALAGLINRPGPTRARFDAWLPHPQGGAALNLATLDLRQRQNHIVATALAEVPASGQRVLAALSLLAGAADWPTLEALCKEVNNLADAVDDLERRGLLFFEADEYDLHPVVRSLALARPAPEDREVTGERVIDHFNSLPHSPYEQAQTLEDVVGGMQVVRTLLTLGRREEAVNAYKGDLANALMYNLDAEQEILALLRPLFPNGWSTLPEGLSLWGQIYLLSHIAGALAWMGNRLIALEACGAALTLHCAEQEWFNAASVLTNLASVIYSDHPAKALALMRQGSVLAKLTDRDDIYFTTQLDLLIFASSAGHLDDMIQTRAKLETMGRDWPRGVYRPGNAEYAYARADFYHGRLSAATLDAAIALAITAHNRATIRALHNLRGVWHLTAANPPSPKPAWKRPSPWPVQSASSTPTPNPGSPSPATAPATCGTPKPRPPASPPCRTPTTKPWPNSTPQSATPRPPSATPPRPIAGPGPMANPMSTASNSPAPPPCWTASAPRSPTCRPTTPRATPSSRGRAPSPPPSPSWRPNRPRNLRSPGSLKPPDRRMDRSGQPRVDPASFREP
jgi:hypothetical protein